jgi:hypothetical protein
LPNFFRKTPNRGQALAEPHLLLLGAGSHIMRQIIFVLILSSILIPMAAVDQGMISSENVSRSELTRYCNVAMLQASDYCVRTENWLRSELR